MPSRSTAKPNGKKRRHESSHEPTNEEADYGGTSVHSVEDEGRGGSSSSSSRSSGAEKNEHRNRVESVASDAALIEIRLQLQGSVELPCGGQLSDVALQLPVERHATVRSIQEAMHKLIRGSKKWDALHLQRKDGTTIELSGDVELRGLWTHGDVLVPASRSESSKSKKIKKSKDKKRKKRRKHRSRSSEAHKNRCRQTLSREGIETKNIVPEIVCFEGFDGDYMIVLNGAPFERAEDLNGHPAYTSFVEGSEYMLCFVPDQTNSWRLGKADDLRQGKPIAVVYAEVDDSTTGPTQIRGGWQVLDKETVSWVHERQVQCIDASPRVRHHRHRYLDRSLSAAQLAQRPRTPSQESPPASRGPRAARPRVFHRALSDTRQNPPPRDAAERSPDEGMRLDVLCHVPMIIDFPELQRRNSALARNVAAGFVNHPRGRSELKIRPYYPESS